MTPLLAINPSKDGRGDAVASNTSRSSAAVRDGRSPQINAAIPEETERDREREGGGERETDREIERERER